MTDKKKQAQTKDANYRDTVTGKYVTEDYAKKHKDTTVKEIDKKKK